MKLNKKFFHISAMVALMVTVSTSLQAQHEGHTMPMPMPDTTKKQTEPAKKQPAPAKKKAAPAKKNPAQAEKKPAATTPQQAPAKMEMPMQTSHSNDAMMRLPLGIAMERMGSGTTWIPDAITLPSRHKMIGEWDVMAHGFVFAQYDHQSGDRGDDQFGSLNWMMLMASHTLAGGHFQARTMLSLDPATVTRRGYPLLLQSGEAVDGEALHDRQHPHDFFMEVGALYQREINSNLAWSIYAAPSGEPALGPVAFMHRPSAMDNPSAPLSHHWQDATHVSFGVVTGGIFSRKWQIEASAFNGREPDEHRWDFDPIKLDSYSARLTANPTRTLSLAAGYGYLKSPEALHPEESLHRFTASLLHGTQWRGSRQISSAFIWGANKLSGDNRGTNSFLGENESILDTRNTVFGRAEFVQKTAEDLAVETSAIDSHDRFNVGALQLGYIRELARVRWSTIGLGAAGTVNFVPQELESQYGSRNPVGLFVFLRLRPFHLRSDSMCGISNMKM